MRSSLFRIDSTTHFQSGPLSSMVFSSYRRWSCIVFQTMEKQLKRNGLMLAFLLVLYVIVSYLIFLRDDFLLERIAFLTNAPWLLEQGRELAKTLHVNSLPTQIYLLTMTG